MQYGVISVVERVILVAGNLGATQITAVMKIIDRKQ